MTKKSAAKTPDLIPQPNGGALYNGGVPGNKGGGRPADRVRAAMLADLEIARPRLLAIVNDPDAKDSDRLKAIEVLAKFGLPAQVELGENPNAPMLSPQERLALVKRHLKL